MSAETVCKLKVRGGGSVEPSLPCCLIKPTESCVEEQGPNGSVGHVHVSHCMNNTIWAQAGSHEINGQCRHLHA